MINTTGEKEQVMASIVAPFVGAMDRDTPVKEVSDLMDSLAKSPIGYAPWPGYAYKPEAHFVVAYSDESVFLKYYIKEKMLKSDYQQTNEPVYKDSCVEFFISFGDKGYYNFEFNCVGTCLCGYGAGKQDRELLPQDLIEKIRRQALIRKEKDTTAPAVYWELTIAIPFEVFCYHPLLSLRGQCCPVNFYKCGDDLPQPHYLSWNNIESEDPNFHLPEFFGKVTFA